MIYVDTREKRWEHIAAYFDKKGVQYECKKLDTGDYMNTELPYVIIDRKRNLDECAQNLYSPDTARFWRELRRAHNEGIKLIFLVEHGGRIKTFEDVMTWNSRYSVKITGRRVAQEMFRAHVAYGVDWKFCQKRSTGEQILRLLKYDEGRDQTKCDDA